MIQLPPFADVEALLVTLLQPVAPGAVYTELPEQFPPPAVRVTRTGGADNIITDLPSVEVTSYGAARAAAWQMDALARQMMLAAGGTCVNGQLIDFVRTATPAQQLPDPREPDLRVVTSSYLLGLRRPRG